MNFAAAMPPPVVEEKTIPFLRNLTEMLKRNSHLISFVPGEKCTTQTTPGKIMIHDRNLVQEEVLPIYFNHKSFASLRRQLSYFSFVRVGKSSRGKVTYANDSVFELTDILKLKRRSTSSDKKAQVHQQKKHYPQKKNPQLMATSSAKEVASAVNSGMLNAAKANEKLEDMKKCAPPAVTSSYCRTYSATHSSLSASSGNERAAKKISNSSKKKRSSSLQKYKLRRKDRARLKKMLYYNRIVPFIHVSSKPMMVEVDTNASSTSRGVGGRSKRVSASNPGNADVKCNKEKMSNTNETAVDALLSLAAPWHRVRNTKDYYAFFSFAFRAEW